MELPALDHLMGAYLHQDYDLFGETPMDAVDTFLRDEPDLAEPLVREIEFLLATTPGEAAVEQKVMDLGCQVYPPSDATGYRGFLELIAERARRRRA